MDMRKYLGHGLKVRGARAKLRRFSLVGRESLHIVKLTKIENTLNLFMSFY